MKRILIVFCLFVVSTSYGQQITYTDATLNDLVQQLNWNKTVTSNSSNIQGSPYLKDEFTEGEIYFDGKFRIEQVPLRVNLSNGEIEFKQKNVVLAISNPKRIDKIVLGEYVFIYIEQQKKGKVDGFVRMWNSDFPSIITKMETKFLAKEPAKPYVEPKPDRFERSHDKHYIMKTETDIENVSSVKKLIKYLGAYEAELSTFAKKEKISAGDVAELVELVDYYHTLQK